MVGEILVDGARRRGGAHRRIGEYGRHIGRVGALAIALGVGGALFGGLGTAHGAPDTTQTSSNAPSSATETGGAADEATDQATDEGVQSAASADSGEQGAPAWDSPSASRPHGTTESDQGSTIEAEVDISDDDAAAEASSTPEFAPEQSAEQSADQSPEQSAEQSADQSPGQSADQSPEQSPEQPTEALSASVTPGTSDSGGAAEAVAPIPADPAAVVTESRSDTDARSITSSTGLRVDDTIGSPDVSDIEETTHTPVDDVGVGVAADDDWVQLSPPTTTGQRTGAAAIPAEVAPGSVPVIKRVLAGVLGLFGWEVPVGEAPLNPFAPDFYNQLMFAAWQRIRYLLGDAADTAMPTPKPADPVSGYALSAAPALEASPSIESATYTLTTIDFDNGLVSGELDIDPASVARYEISGGLKGTVLLTDNAFEYRPTAQAQEAASAPGAGYEVQYDNFDVLAIGTNGTATKVHVDVPVLGQPPPDQQPTEPTPPQNESPPPADPTPPEDESPSNQPSNDIVYKLDMLDFAPFLEDEGDVFGSTLDAETIQQRLDLVAAYTNGIRTFSAYNSKDLVRLADEMGMTVYAGAWIDAGNDALVGADGRTQAEVEVDELIDLANKGYVDVAIVGSETIYHGQMSEDRVVELMDRFRTGSTNPDVQVVTALKAETLLNTIPGREGQVDPQKLINAGDFVYYNTYPFWSGVSIDNALNRLTWEHQQIVDIAGGKEVQISETGWPSHTDPANPNGAAVGTPENAQRYFDEVTDWARNNGVFLSWFGSFDLPSRAQLEGPSLAGAYWGIWDHTGELKTAYETVFTDAATPPQNPPPPPAPAPAPVPVPVPEDPSPAPQDPAPSPIGSATYTLTTIDFDNGLVSGELDIDPATVARYEISGGLKGTVLLTDNAFEYRPTAQAQEAASAPGAGYEVQYDNFDVLAIGTNGTATKVHVDVPVLGQPPFDVR